MLFSGPLMHLPFVLRTEQLQDTGQAETEVYKFSTSGSLAMLLLSHTLHVVVLLFLHRWAYQS